MSEARAELPENWEWVRLEDVCHAQSGGTPRRGISEYYGGDIPWAKIEDLTRAGKWISATDETITEQALKKTNARIFPANTVLFAMYGSIGTTSIAAVPLSTNQAILGCQCSERILPEFLYSWFQLVKAELLARGRGGTQANVNATIIRSLEIPLPSIDEQIRLVEVLQIHMAEVDKARAATEAQLEAAGELPISILRDVFESATIQSEKWVKLGDVCQTTSGGTPARGVTAYYGGSIPWVKSGELEDGLIASTGETITQAGLDGSSAKLFPSGTLLIALYGATVGKLGVLGVEAASNQAVCGISVGERVLRDYLFYFLLYYRDELVKISFGGAQPNISQKVVRSVSLPLPSIAEQQRSVDFFQSKLADVEKLNSFLQGQLETINALPSSLLRQAFSGELIRQPSPEHLRAALTCLAVERLHHRVFFGVVQLMKVLYFAQAQLGIPLGYTMRRHTYGPFDKAVYDLEKEGERQGWFSVDKAVDKQGSRYVPGAELDDLAREAEGILSRWKGKLNGLLELAESFDTTGLEALATLHAAWNDLLLEGRQPTDGEIIAEVLEGWPGKADKFSKGELRQYLAYLKTSPYVPKGTGQSTRLTHAA